MIIFMKKELEKIKAEFIEQVKNSNSVLGVWDSTSLDTYSKHISDKVILCWTEGFNERQGEREI